ncbi:hypothetical protein mRhiFer1_009354 [Rhinolophus ferrumequinum]|uniref:Uncharacterized protein n=1 Tax=Rhinolophus ferrumequinum TaxID=59479 RepID=A0A7J7RQ54_RHIFE|nr:hypothetical protein mRhiFer1_009354 [Rhinolophus ferrumequinum]
MEREATRSELRAALHLPSGHDERLTAQVWGGCGSLGILLRGWRERKARQALWKSARQREQCSLRCGSASPQGLRSSRGQQERGLQTAPVRKREDLIGRMKRLVNLAASHPAASRGSEGASSGRFSQGAARGRELLAKEKKG